MSDQHNEGISLNSEDWEILLPGTKHTLGKTELNLVPLGLEQLKEVVSHITALQDKLEEKNITSTNYHEPDKIIYVAEMVLEKIPHLVSKSSGLRLADVMKLPPAPATSLVNALVKINIESQEDLIKNLTALAEMIQGVAGTGTSETSPTSSSGKATRSGRSKGTRSGK